MMTLCPTSDHSLYIYIYIYIYTTMVTSWNTEPLSRLYTAICNGQSAQHYTVYNGAMHKANTASAHKDKCINNISVGDKVSLRSKENSLPMGFWMKERVHHAIFCNRKCTRCAWMHRSSIRRQRSFESQRPLLFLQLLFCRFILRVALAMARNVIG